VARREIRQLYCRGKKKRKKKKTEPTLLARIKERGGCFFSCGEKWQEKHQSVSVNGGGGEEGDLSSKNRKDVYKNETARKHKSAEGGE